MFLVPEFSLGLKMFKESVLDWVLMFLLANNNVTVLKDEILYMFLMIWCYLLVFFFIQTCLFMIMCFVGAKRAWFGSLKCVFWVWQRMLGFMGNLSSCSSKEHCLEC
jgi:hypothetical protein